MKLEMKKLIAFISISIFITLLYGCAATHTIISKRHLDVQTKMSETIFLDPVESEQKTVFIQVRNTSGNNHLDVERQLAGSLVSKGYTVVNSPNAAHYLIQANILQIGKRDLRESTDVLEQGFGGGLIGAGVGSISSNNSNTIVGASLIGAAAGIVGNALVKDNFYTLITDLQISERAQGQIVSEEFHSDLKQGASTTKALYGRKTSEWKRYQTRIISTANKMNLKLEEAIPELVVGLSNSISGLL